ncbi:MAG TPA: methylenetetrahydrofolate reductase C-terminal domain-containing protein [Vicinamibacterales bacterium]|nr:methylenetetrahydrofolate reductase C-terminal domain-containing protein [Vicinamibacterales bacterium]
MHTLREKLEQSSRFVVGCELVSVRGSMTARGAIKVRDFANELVACPDVDWISITDNAGGNPQLAPQALGKPMLYAGKEVVIHLTCKDLNRNGLESEAWLLNSEGFHNVLAMTGDYPLTGSGGTAKPVFDIDSIGLISMLSAMNDGFQPRETRAGRTPERLAPTSFFIGAVTTNYKRHEGEVMPQYRKLEKKVAAGARFIINQVGYDARKAHELRLYMDHHAMPGTPLIGNVYVLTPVVAKLFHDARIPGIVVSPELLRLAEVQGASPDRGKAFFLELAAKQIAIFKGLGYRGAYLGGVHGFDAIARILTIERSFAPDDWKQFAREIAFSRDGEFFFYGKDPATGLADPRTRDRTAPPVHARTSVVYRLSKWTHAHLFEPGHAISRWGASVCAHASDPRQGPALLRVVERASKAALFDCRDCGDCSLPEIAYLCPESQCAKNQRNGPCGGTRDGKCEVDGFGDCIWLRAYERRAHDGDADHLLDHAPVVQDQGLRGTSSWANHWLGRDHTSRPAEPVTTSGPSAAPPLALEGRQPTTATK